MTEQPVDVSTDGGFLLPDVVPDPFPGDPTATWQYWTDLDTADAGVKDAWVHERLVNRVNDLLAECDWAVVSDAEWNTAPWIAYRRALRALKTAADPRRVTWPVKPS